MAWKLIFLQSLHWVKYQVLLTHGWVFLTKSPNISGTPFHTMVANLVSFISTQHNLESFWKRLIWENVSAKLTCRWVCRGIFPTDDWCERARPTMGRTRKKAEQAMRKKQANEQHSIVAPASAPASRGSCLEFLTPDFPWWWVGMWNCKLKPSPP